MYFSIHSIFRLGINLFVFSILLRNVLSFTPSDMQNKTRGQARERKLNILQKLSNSWTRSREPLGDFDLKQVFFMVSLIWLLIFVVLIKFDYNNYPRHNKMFYNSSPSQSRLRRQQIWILKLDFLLRLIEKPWKWDVKVIKKQDKRKLYLKTCLL